MNVDIGEVELIDYNIRRQLKGISGRLQSTYDLNAVVRTKVYMSYYSEFSSPQQFYDTKVLALSTAIRDNSFTNDLSLRGVTANSVTSDEINIIIPKKRKMYGTGSSGILIVIMFIYLLTKIIILNQSHSI
jgi:hypothetical protein